MTNHTKASRPNIVLLISHDLGCHIGPYGHAYQQTPALNQFAQEGMRLDRHFVSSPGCSQSRSSLVTGRYPHSNGQFGLANWGWKMNENEVLLPQVLKDHGYQTTLFGIWHLHEWTLSSFCNTSDDVSTLDYSSEGVAEVASHRAANWLQNNSNLSQPFYLHVGFWEVHRPFCENTSQCAASVEDLSEIELPGYLPDTEATRLEFIELMRSVSLVDRGVARILETLNKTGLAKNTIVIFTADHGLPFQRAKATLYDPGIQVAGLVRWPGHINAGSSSQTLTSNIDIMPTLLDAVGIPIRDEIQGRSLINLLHGVNSDEMQPEAVFAEKTYHEHYDPIRCVRTDRYKYIRNFAQRPMLVLPSDVYNSPSRKSFTEDSALWDHRPLEEFYDLDNDPLELDNLVTSANVAKDLEESRQRLMNWMETTQDPLRKGPIGRPIPIDCQIEATSMVPPK